MWAAVVLLVILGPALLFFALTAFVPDSGHVPRWRTRLANGLEAIALRLRHPHHSLPDPFDTLRVQDRLGVVARHVQSLEADHRAMARAERIIASQLAYDDLLAEACHLAGVDVPPHAKGDPAERFREEVELAGRGWTW